MKILLFGTGDYYTRYRKWFVQHDVLALLDNSRQKQHTVIDGMEVLPPEEGIQLEYDIIVILSFYVEQMRRQLLALGVDADRIFHFYDLHRLLGADRVAWPVEYFLDAQAIAEGVDPSVPKVLLLSNDLELGGPAIALLHAAKVLTGQGYAVVYASMLDGPLKSRLLAEGIPVIVDNNLQVSTMLETRWVSSFSLLVCNTLNFHVFLSERDIRIPVIWWLHDAPFFYEGVSREVIGKICPANLKAVSVGPVPSAAVREFLPGLACEELLYGVADAGYSTAQEKEKGITRFITIGFLEKRKGQDILLQAVKELPEHIRHRSRFYIVGHTATLFGEQIRSESSDISGIVFTERVGREELHELLDSSDVLVCPSRQDPMPTVAAEAMMHSVPCIVSDATGTAAYIRDGEDGFVFPCGNAQALAQKIAWCVENRDRLDGMGKNARQLYEKQFSMPVFERRLMEVVQGALKEQ